MSIGTCISYQYSYWLHFIVFVLLQVNIYLVHAVYTRGIGGTPSTEANPIPSQGLRGCDGEPGAKRQPRTSCPASQPRTGNDSETCKGKKQSTHPPSLQKHGLVAVRELDINRLCLDRRDGIGDVINRLDDRNVATDGMGPKRRSHVFAYLIVVVENLLRDSVMRSSGNHKLKEGIARISDVTRFGGSLGELISGEEVFAVPAVKATRGVKVLVVGRKARDSDLIGIDRLLPESSEKIEYMGLQSITKLCMRAGGDQLINEEDAGRIATVKLER